MDTVESRLENALNGTAYRLHQYMLATIKITFVYTTGFTPLVDERGIQSALPLMYLWGQ